ncbi:MAG: polysaccharide deacetylase family protein [Lentisphaeria bacterium]
MKNLTTGGVLLTFDDNNNIDSWYNAIDLFREFNAKATFFINAPDEINNTQWQQLKELAEQGHDVGCHGWRHEKAVDYCHSHSLEAWLRNEILIAYNALRDRGFNVTSYGYPCSQQDPVTNHALKQYFHHARTGTGFLKNQALDELNEIYTPLKKVPGRFLLPGKSIDKLKDISLIENAFQRAARQSEIVVFYGHRLGTEEEGKKVKNLTYINFLRKVLEQAQTKKLEFYTFQDLPFSH